MDKEAARQIVIEEAQRAGVDPAIALSVWEQEGGGTTDLSLRGETLPKGKWKGHYARGPWQIMSFHGEIPQDFRGQTRWAMNHLKERGVRGYYGTGEPVVPGHPTTDQYEAEVLARAGRIDPRTASTEGAGPAVSPHTLPDRSAPMPPAAGVPPMEIPEFGIGDALLNFGLGVLNNQGPNWAGSGMQAVQNARQQQLLMAGELYELEQARQQAAIAQRAAQQQAAAQERLAQQYDEAGDYNTAAMIRAGLVGKGDLLQQDKSLPAAVQEALFRAGGDEERAREIMNEENAPVGPDPVQYGKPGTGERWVDPDDPEQGVEPIPGTSEDVKRKEQARLLDASFAAIDTMRGLIEDHGEGLDLVFNQKAQSRMGQVYAELMALMARLNNAGVLQPGEVEQIKRDLPDPRKRFTFVGQNAIIAAFDQLEDRLARQTGREDRMAPPLGEEAAAKHERNDWEGFRVLPGGE